MSEAANYLFKAEEELRKLATDLQRGVVDEDEFERRISEVQELIESGERKIPGDVPTRADITSALVEVYGALNDLKTAVEETPYDLRQWKGRFDVDSGIDEYLRDVSDVVRELTGRGCYAPGMKSLTMRIDNFAACVHRLAEHVQETTAGQTIGKCIISPNATERAKKLCELWDKYTEKMREWGRYSAGDYDALKGWVIDDKAYFRVGSAAGHRTFVDLSRGVLNYYDTDRDVNEAMERVWEEFLGASCEVWNRGVDCVFKPPTTDDEIKRLAATIAQPTSLDFRLGNPSQYYDVEEIINKYMPDLKKEIERIVEEAFREAGL